MSTSVVNCAAYAKGKRVADVDISAIREMLRQPDRFVWIGLHEPDEELLRRVQREFGLHDLAIEDAHRAHQRPKLERYGDALFIVLRTVHVDQARRRGEFGETHLFVGARYLVSVRHGASLPYTEVRARCEGTPHLLDKGPGFALYALMDFVVDQYFPLVDALEDELEDLEGEILNETPSRATTRRIYLLRRELLELKRAVSPLVDISNRLMRADIEVIPEDTRPYFRDIYDHVLRINEIVDALRELLTTALEASLSLMSLGQNESMRRLTAWAAIIAVPTMVAGIYGMNFEFMPELKWRLGYPVVLLATVTVCGLLYRHFKKTGSL
jgi:magnesium transporter